MNTAAAYSVHHHDDFGYWQVRKNGVRVSGFYRSEQEANSAVSDYRKADLQALATEMLEVLKFVQDRLRGDHECFQRVSDMIAKAAA